MWLGLEDKCKVVEAYFIHSSFSVKEANKYEAHFKEINSVNPCLQGPGGNTEFLSYVLAFAHLISTAVGNIFLPSVRCPLICFFPVATTKNISKAIDRNLTYYETDILFERHHG